MATKASAQRTRTIQIEINESEENVQIKKEKKPGEISPAFEHNVGFKKAAKKMPAIGNETKFPRNDNAFMAKESLSYDDSNSKIWLERPKKFYES